MRVLLVTAMKKEFHCGREIFAATELSFRKGFRFAEKKSKKLQIHILQCGYYPSDALDFYAGSYGVPDLLIDSGSCGALAENITTGTVFSVIKVKKTGSQTLYYDTSSFSDSLKTAALIEVQRAVNKKEVRSELATEAELCSMESYEICLKAKAWECRHYSFRVVTDLSNEEMTEDFKLNFRESCRSLYRYINTFLNDLSH